MEKVTLYEDFMVGGKENIVLPTGMTREALIESLEKNEGRLLVTLPVGYVDKPTGNGRTYERKEVERAFKAVETEMKEGGIHGAHGEHPASVFVPPDKVSHLITKGWVAEDGHIMNQWLVLNTTKGKDLKEMFLAGAKIGTSIRGVGVEKTENQGKFVREYEYGGTDTVGFPSTGVRVGKSVPKVEISFVESANLEIKPLVESLEEPKEKPDSENPETEPETDTTKSQEALLATIKDQLKEFITALHLDEKKIDLEKFADMQRIKVAEIVNVSLEKLSKKVESLQGDVTKKDAQLTGNSERIEKYEKLVVKQKEYSGALEEVAKDLRAYALRLEKTIEEFVKRVKVTEDVLNEIRFKAGEDKAPVWIVEDIRTYSLSVEEVAVALMGKLKESQVKYEASNAVVEKLREDIKNSDKPLSYTDHAVHQVAGALMRKFPTLVKFREELYQARTVEECRRRSIKYLNIYEGRHYTTDDLDRDMKTEKKVVESQERHLPDHRSADKPKVKGWH